LDIDYIGLGAYRDTSTKKDIKGVLGSYVEKLSKLSTHPVAIIGGVKVKDEIDFAEYRVVGSDLYLYY
jgi:thiamine-phosphate pyrophosphorylase